MVAFPNNFACVVLIVHVHVRLCFSVHSKGNNSSWLQIHAFNTHQPNQWMWFIPGWDRTHCSRVAAYTLNQCWFVVCLKLNRILWNLILGKHPLQQATELSMSGITGSFGVTELMWTVRIVVVQCDVYIYERWLLTLYILTVYLFICKYWCITMMD